MASTAALATNAPIRNSLDGGDGRREAAGEGGGNGRGPGAGAWALARRRTWNGGQGAGGSKARRRGAEQRAAEWRGNGARAGLGGACFSERTNAGFMYINLA